MIMMMVLFVSHEHITNGHEDGQKNNEGYFQMRRYSLIVLFPFAMKLNWALLVMTMPMSMSVTVFIIPML